MINGCDAQWMAKKVRVMFQLYLGNGNRRFSQ
jgi:hypothetical protein